MFKFNNVHIYRNHSNNLDFLFIMSELHKFFPTISIDIRNPFLNNMDNIFTDSLLSARIYDIKKPYHEQQQRKMMGTFDKSVNYDGNTARQCEELILYDAFLMQRLLGTIINDIELTRDHVHLVFEDRLICTFSEEDWRYHARTFVGGNPSIISTTGIIEAPAKPKEWYIKQMQLAIYDIDDEGDHSDGKSSSNVKNYLDYGDYRINFAAVGCALQALFFFILEGDPFCRDINCRLYNAHWQEELITSQIQNQKLCNEHMALLNQFNKYTNDGNNK
ncbi:MAG TPA: DUF6775 family putative metallopeptidase [Candidatus Nitrosocosmicus sp.]|nr:DUF6775 family putative metallopeptidase [Candidatus Nitrosocosmicus sp.]